MFNSIMEQITAWISSPWVNIGCFVFGIIITHLYYKKSSKDQKKQNDKSLTSQSLILYKLQNPNAETEIKYDENGHASGLIVNMSAKLKGNGGIKGILSNKKK